MGTDSVAELLLDIFGGNPYHAVGKRRSDGRTAWYEPQEGPITKELITQHLNGETILGAYPVDSKNNSVRWLGWDIDAADNLKEARRITVTITNEIQHLPYVVEFSGGKGYHVLLFLEEPMPASKAKAFSEYIRDKHNLPKVSRKGHSHVECYPKQAEVSLSQDGTRQKVGNLLKLPLGQHILSNEWSRFVDMGNGWEDGPSLPPEEMLLLRVDPAMLSLDGAEGDKLDKLAYVLAGEWISGERHNLALFIAGYLASSNWTEEQAEDLITRICTYRDDPEIDNRLQAVTETFAKHRKGEQIAGYQRLADILPAPAMTAVVQLVAELAAPDTAKRIEKIRFAKGPVWKKEERASALIWSHLTDPEIGLILRTPGDEFYWYDVQNRVTVNLRSVRWEATLYRLFRINVSEAFGRHIATIIEMKARMEAIMIDVYKGSYWDGHDLLVNLGDSRVWRLDGETISEESNGEKGILFATTEWHRIPTPNFDHPVDVWSRLVDDINFASGTHTPIPGEQQAELLKAWILSTFFREELPTRPILTMLGDSGSGKTTAAKRIVQMLEGVEENVLSIEEDKPDFWRTVIANHRIFCLDNLEQTRARWLINGLDRIATGSMIEIRELYKTNALYRIKPDCFVVLTAVNMPFSKDTIFQRLLTVNMDKLVSFIPQRVYEQRMKQDIHGMWGDMLLKLNQVVKTLQETKDVALAVTLRMADFAQFCERLRHSDVVNGDTLKKGLAVLGSAQQLALAQSEFSAYPIIQEWVETYPEEAGKWHTTNELYAILSNHALKLRRPFRWKDSRGLSSHIRAMEAVLIQNLGCQVKDQHLYEHGRWLKAYRFKPLGDQLIMETTDEED